MIIGDLMSATATVAGGLIGSYIEKEEKFSITPTQATHFLLIIMTEVSESKEVVISHTDTGFCEWSRVKRLKDGTEIIYIMLKRTPLLNLMAKTEVTA